MAFQGQGHGVGAGTHQSAVVPSRAAGNAAQLRHHIPRADAGTQGQGDQAGNGFQLGRIAAAGLAQSAEHLKGRAAVAEIDGDIHIAVAGAYPLGKAVNFPRPFPGRPPLGDDPVIALRAIVVNRHFRRGRGRRRAAVPGA